MNSIRPKKKNLFTFIKSDDFNKARVKLCAMYIILSYANELHEDIDRLLQGYDGIWIGDLKHASKLASKALEDYDKEYLSWIGDGSALTDTNVEMTTALDVAIQQNQFFFQEGSKILRKIIEEQTSKTIYNEEEVKRGFFMNHEFVSPNERKSMLEATIKQCRRRLPDFKGDVLKGVEVGFNAAIDFLQDVYMKS